MTKKPTFGQFIDQAIDRLGNILENGVLEIELDAVVVERENKQRVYDNLAKFVKNKLNSSLEDSLGAICILCNEKDEHILKDSASSIEVKKLIEQLKSFIVMIKIHYEKLNATNYHCEIEIYYYENKTKVTRISEEINRDQLPQVARECFLQNDDKKMSFKLFPIENYSAENNK